MKPTQAQLDLYLKLDQEIEAGTKKVEFLKDRIQKVASLEEIYTKSTTSIVKEICVLELETQLLVGDKYFQKEQLEDLLKTYSQELNELLNDKAILDEKFDFKELKRPSCYECKEDISSSFGYICDNCDFKLCYLCFLNNSHEHNALQKVCFNDYYESRWFEKYDEALIHYYNCKVPNCPLLACRKLKEVSDHVRKCDGKGGDCEICQRVKMMLEFHSVNCKHDQCKVFLCAKLKKEQPYKRKNSNKYGYTGVHLTHSGKYDVRLKFKTHEIYCGTYETKEEAAKVYDQAKVHLLGEAVYKSNIPLNERTRLNFPGDVEKYLQNTEIHPNVQIIKNII